MSSRQLAEWHAFFALENEEDDEEELERNVGRDLRERARQKGIRWQ